MRRRTRADPALPVSANRREPTLLTQKGGQKTCPTRCCIRFGWVLSLLLFLFVLFVVDFSAILEGPDPIDSEDEFQSKRSQIIHNKTLILMIETQKSPAKTVCINREYAARNGYDFELVTHHECFDRPVFAAHMGHLWCRPRIFQERLQHYPSLLYLDTDAYFVNASISLSDFFQYARDHDYYVSEQKGHTTFVGAQDCDPYWTNGGIQFWKKTRYTNRMLSTWYLMYKRQFILYWLLLSKLPTYEIHYFRNREQGSFQMAVQESKDWMQDEVSVIRYGPETWHLSYNDTKCQGPGKRPIRDTYFLNHIVGNFGVGARKLWISNHMKRNDIHCDL